MAPIDWHAVLIPAVPLGEKILRPVIIYFGLIFMLRVAGKRELAQLNPLDLIVLLTLSNAVQDAIIGPDDSVLGGLLGAVTLIAVNYLVVSLAHRSTAIEELIEGGPDVVIKKGRLQQNRLESERISPQELEAAARRQGFASLKDVDQAILYPGGTFCFIGKVPSSDAIHHQQIMAELNRLRLELRELRPT